MNKHLFTVNGNILQRVISEPMTSNSQGFDKCEFRFNEEWEGFSKTAVFYRSPLDKRIVLIENDMCEFPPEISKIIGECYVGVIGVSETKTGEIVRIATNPYKVMVEEGVSSEYSQNPEYEAAILDQMLVLFEKYHQDNIKINKTVADNAVAADKSAKAALASETEAKKVLTETKTTMEKNVKNSIISKMPYADKSTGEWMVWDPETSAYKKTGIMAVGGVTNKFRLDAQGKMYCKAIYTSGYSTEVCLGTVAPTYRGVYSGSDSYPYFSLVTYNGNLYISKKDVPSGVLPTESVNEFWDLVTKKGEVGKTPKFSVGNVETVSSSSEAGVDISGTLENVVLSFRIPKGETGETGDITVELQNLKEVVLVSEKNSKHYYDEVLRIYTQYNGSVTDSINQAMNAANEANKNAIRAEQAIGAIEEALKGANTIIDDATGISYKLGIENGGLYIEEVLK